MTDHRERGLTMQLDKVHSVRTLALVARDLGRDEDWFADLALAMEPEDGLIWIYNPQHEDGTRAFTEIRRRKPAQPHRHHRDRTT